MSNYWKKKMDELNKSNSSSSYWKSRLAELEKEEQKKKDEDLAPVAKTASVDTKKEENKLSFWDALLQANAAQQYDNPAAAAGAALGTAINNAFRKDEDEDKEKWYEGWFQKGASEENVGKAAVGTSADAGTDLLTGVIGLGETLVDWGAGLAPYIAQAQYYQNGGGYNIEADKVFNQSNEAFKKDVQKFVEKDLYDEEEVAKTIISGASSAAYMYNITQGGGFATPEQLEYARQMQQDTKSYLDNEMEEDSVFAHKVDELMQSAGQLAGTAAISATGIPWWVVSGGSAWGSELENSLQQGATLEEANLSGAISATAEVLTEQISGGIKFGGNTLDDALTKRLAANISSKFWRNAAKLGMDMAGEGVEEVLSEDISRFGQWLTYQDEKTLVEMLWSEEAMDAKIQAFLSGAVLGGGGSVTNAVKSAAAGVDAVSGLTKNEQAVVDKVYNDRVAEAEEKGEVSQKQKSKIYDEVLGELEKGDISTETIEEVLGGETYKAYKNTVDSEDALQKEYDELRKVKTGESTLEQQERYRELKQQLADLEKTSKRKQLKSQLGEEVFSLVKSDRLVESYNEKGRRSQAFEADLSEYSEKERATVQRAIDSGILNNTNKSHRFVDMIAKVSAEKGVPFDFANNAKLKESGFALDGVTVNGFVNSNGVTINIDSAKALNSVVGHEITHVLEGTEFYETLKTTIEAYAKSKGEYDSRLKTLQKLYEGKEGYTGEDAAAKIEQELVADLVGDYLFTDMEFVNRLSTENRGVFQKIFDEVKYLCKVATAGSKEARQLEKVKKAFEDAYRTETKNPTENGGVRYALGSSSTQNDITANYQKTVDSILQGTHTDKSSVLLGYTPDVYQELGMPSLPFVIGPGHIYSTVKTEAEARLENRYNKKMHYHGLGDNAVKNIYKAAQDPLMIIASKDVSPKTTPLRSTHSIVAIVDVGTGDQHLLLPVEITAKRTVNGEEMDVNVLSSAYNKNVSELVREAVALENIGEVGVYYIKKGATLPADSGVQFPVHLSDKIASNGIIHSFSEKVNMNISNATQSQQFKRWFGDWQNHPENASKVINADGTPMVVYHGSADQFDTFSYGRIGSASGVSILGDGFYFTDKKKLAKNYGGNLYACYLQMTTPYQATEADAYKLNSKKLQSQGYDGVIMKTPSGTVYMVFDNTQIKSATDNIGTFDGSNPDIRYSVSERADASDDLAPLPGNIYGKDVALQKVYPDDYAPVGGAKESRQTGKEYISLEDYANRESSVWRNVAYDDETTKASIMQQTHDTMVAEGAVVAVTDAVTSNVEQAFPDLRDMKKKERNPILKSAMTRLKSDLRQFLSGFKNQAFEFDVNGKVLDATLYNTGINEVLEKVTKEKASMLYSTEDIFRNARYLYSTPDYDGDPNVFRWNYFYTPVQIGEETVGVRIAVRDMATPRESQIYNWGIKKDTSLDDVGRGTNDRISHGASSDVSNNNIPEIAPVVKQDHSTQPADGLLNDNLREALESLIRGDAPPKTNRQDTDSAGAKKIAVGQRKALHQGIIEGIKTKFQEKGLDFDKVLKDAKNLSTFATVDNTPQRVMEKSLGYKEGQVLSDITVNKVAQNETEGIKWLNSYLNRKDGLLAQISKQYNIKPGSKESAAAQMYAEGFYVDETNAIIQYGDAELAKDFPDATVQRNIKSLASDPRIRQIYDETLAAINESRTRNAYPEIPRLDNYFLHFRAMEDTFSRLGLPFNPNDIKAKDLPTDLNGVTADLKPGQPYFASAKHRTGKRTSFDLLGGVERYLTSAKDQIFHIDDIQTLRALRNYIADTYGQANGLDGLNALSEEEAQERIKQVYDSHLSTFAKFLNEEANILAGKTSLIDRGLEGVIGRCGITFLNSVNRQVGANMVGFNASSSLTNFLPVVQTFAKTNKVDFVRAFGQTVANKVGSVFGRTDGFTENSPVIVRRKGADRIYRTAWQKLSDPGYALMSAVDDISTELIARTKYNELTRKGMDAQQAHLETDKWVSRLMGDRSLGQQPQIYNSKMLGLVTKFQLEVRNQLDSQFYDTIQEAKTSTEEIENGLARNAKRAAKITSTFFQLAVAQHVFGTAFESVAGYNPAFDIIEVMIKTFGWDDEEDSEDTVLDNVEEGFLALLEDLPYTSTLTGGRIPISSALPVEQLVSGKDQYGNEKSRWETLAEALPYYVLPGGYGQIKKTYNGLKMFSDEDPVAGSYTDSDNLRFPVDDTAANKVQAALFGQWANENARYYFDNDLAPLDEKRIQEYTLLGLPYDDYWAYRDDMSAISKRADVEGASDEDIVKSKYIRSVDTELSAIQTEKEEVLKDDKLTDKQKAARINDLDKQFAGLVNERYNSYNDVSFDGDYANIGSSYYQWYTPEEGDPYWRKLTETQKTKYLVTSAAGDANYATDGKVHYRRDEDGEWMKISDKQLARQKEVTRALGITPDEYWSKTSISLMPMPNGEYEYAYDSPENYAVAKAVGGYDAYKGYSSDLYDIKADKDENGKSINGSRKEKVIEYINNLDADYETKIILFKKEYPSDDTYNYEIVKYLNGREDLSYKEMETILKELGFDVDADGNISW